MENPHWYARGKGRPDSVRAEDIEIERTKRLELELDDTWRNLRRRLKRLKLHVKKNDFIWELTDDEAIELLTSAECHYCKQVRRTDVISLKVFANGYVNGNVVPSCRLCDKARGAQRYEDFASLAEKMAEVYNAMLASYKQY
jgi:hypothetical protein